MIDVLTRSGNPVIDKSVPLLHKYIKFLSRKLYDPEQLLLIPLIFDFRNVELWKKKLKKKNQIKFRLQKKRTVYNCFDRSPWGLVEGTWVDLYRGRWTAGQRGKGGRGQRVTSSRGVHCYFPTDPPAISTALHLSTVACH